MLIASVNMLSFSYARKNTAKPNYQTNIPNTNCTDTVSFSAKVPVHKVERELFHTRDVGIKDLLNFFDRLYNRKKQTTLGKKDVVAINALRKKIMAIVNEELPKSKLKYDILDIVNKDARLNIREARYVLGSKELHVFGWQTHNPISLHFDNNGKITRIENVERTVYFEQNKDKISIVKQEDTSW